MLLLFNKSDRLECAKVVVLKFGAILFYSGIHCKPLKLWKKNIAKIWIGTFHKSWHLPEGTPSITWCLLTSWIREPNYFMYIGVKYYVFQGLSYIYCRVRSIFPTIFILILEYYGHHTYILDFFCCSFDWPPKDDHILVVSFLKMTTCWKPNSQYYNKIW